MEKSSSKGCDMGRKWDYGTEISEFICEDTNYLKERLLWCEVVDLGVTVGEEDSGGEEEGWGKPVKRNGQVFKFNSVSDSGTSNLNEKQSVKGKVIADKEGSRTHKMRHQSVAIGEEV